MTPSIHPSPIEHTLSLGSFRNWMRLLVENGGFDREFWLRVLLVSLTTLLTAPLRFLQRILYSRAINRTDLRDPPIFIVGHWRTGTTHLHNLLACDGNLGYVSLFQATAPGFALLGNRFIKPVLAAIAARAHPTRIIDNVPLLMDAPQEEEFAVANLAPCSFINIFTFPRRGHDIMTRYVLFEGLSAPALAEWKRVYLYVLRQAAMQSNGKRLVLKNPSHCGRIAVLLELFPNSKFIHIYRSPYEVFVSTRHVYENVLPRTQVQKISMDQVETLVLDSYCRLMQKFLVDKARIPAGNLVEVRFEDLEAEPLEQLRRIYDTLGLPGFAEAEPAFRAYVASISGYRKNPYQLDGGVIARVNRYWGFAFDAWGYTRRSER